MVIPITNFDVAEAQTELKIEKTYNDLKYKHEQINIKSKTPNSDIEVNNLKSEYIRTLKELNTLSYVEPQRDYLAEWTALDSIVMTLEDLQVQTYSSKVQQRINYLYTQMDKIEQESIASMQLDPVVEERLLELEEKLYNKYSNLDHETYVGSNSVDFPYVDAEQQKVILLIDESKALAENGASAISIAHEMMDSHGIDNITVDFVNITPLTCTSLTSDCDPLIGGISLARDDSRNSLAGSVGFRAKDSNNNAGFVTAGHVGGGMLVVLPSCNNSNNNAGFVTAGHVVQYLNSTNTKMRQPVGGSIVGTIPSNGDNVCYTKGGVDKGERTGNGQKCDFAFVKMNSGVSINDDIYKSSRRTYDINAMAVESDHKKGRFLKWVGASSGIQTAKIHSYSSTTERGIIEQTMQSPGGDSGGPLFKSTAGPRNTYKAEVFGILTENLGRSGDRIVYEPAHKIMDELNLKPYH